MQSLQYLCQCIDQSNARLAQCETLLADTVSKFFLFITFFKSVDDMLQDI